MEVLDELHITYSLPRDGWNRKKERLEKKERQKKGKKKAKQTGTVESSDED